MWQLHWRNEVNLIPNASQRQLKILIQSGRKLSDWKEKGQNLFHKECIIRITFTDSSEGEHRKTVILRYMHICINIIYIIKMGNRYPLFLGKNYDIRMLWMNHETVLEENMKSNKECMHHIWDTLFFIYNLQHMDL